MSLRVISTEPPHPSTKPIPKPGEAEQGCWCSGDSPHGRDFFSPFSQSKEGNWYQLGPSSAAQCWGHTSSEKPPTFCFLPQACSSTRNRNLACCRWFIWNFFLQSENSIYFSYKRQGYTFDKDHSNSRHRVASHFSCVQAGSPATCFKICGNNSFPAFLGLWSNPWGSLYCTHAASSQLCSATLFVFS